MAAPAPVARSETLGRISAATHMLAKMRLSVDRLHKCEVDPELLRGISMMTLLRSDTFQGHDLAGKTFDDNAAHRLYACSRPTGQLDLFVSHSWRASSSGKWLALNVRMNGSTAAVASVVVAGALAAARRQGLLPAGLAPES